MMKKLISVVLTLVMICMLAVPAMAANEPVITRQPQNLNFVADGYAEYSVTVHGKNLKCKWFLKFNGDEYDIAETDGNPPWSHGIKNTCGSKQTTNGDFTTFTFYIDGIGESLDGCNLYAKIEDGHFEVTSDVAIISVTGKAAPPKIIVAAGMGVEQGSPLDLYCEATAPNKEKLSYLWYETSTGKLQDIVAINKGAEDKDTLRCDTSSVGTRYYVCMVTTSAGGSAYSSVIPVTVTKKEEGSSIPVLFTADSSPVPGKSMTVDIEKMTNYDARVWNAFLERTVGYQWYKDGAKIKGATGKTLAITEKYVGSEIHVVVTCDDLVLQGEAFPVTQPIDPPEIKTETLPEAFVGKKYSEKLECTDADAVFSVYDDPGKANEFDQTGLNLTQHGELEGTPWKAGTYTFTICASGEGGEGYRSYTLTVTDTMATDPENPTPTPEGGGEGEQGTQPGGPSSGNEGDQEPNGMPWWAIALIVVAAGGAGAGISIAVTKKKK